MTKSAGLQPEECEDFNTFKHLALFAPELSLTINLLSVNIIIN